MAAIPTAQPSQMNTPSFLTPLPEIQFDTHCKTTRLRKTVDLALCQALVCPLSIMTMYKGFEGSGLLPGLGLRGCVSNGALARLCQALISTVRECLIKEVSLSQVDSPKYTDVRLIKIRQRTTALCTFCPLSVCNLCYLLYQLASTSIQQLHSLSNRKGKPSHMPTMSGTSETVAHVRSWTRATEANEPAST